MAPSWQYILPLTVAHIPSRKYTLPLTCVNTHSLFKSIKLRVRCLGFTQDSLDSKGLGHLCFSGSPIHNTYRSSLNSGWLWHLQTAEVFSCNWTVLSLTASPGLSLETQTLSHGAKRLSMTPFNLWFSTASKNELSPAAS